MIKYADAPHLRACDRCLTCDYFKGIINDLGICLHEDHPGTVPENGLCDDYSDIFWIARQSKS
jgi:hypothetical protein